MNKVDQLRELDIMNEADHCLSKLLETQLNAMEPLRIGKRPIARQGLAAVYAGLANALQAHELGHFEEAGKYRNEAGKKFSEMRTQLESR